MTSILLVDDEVALLRTLSMNLRARGYEVLTAESGEDALARVRRDSPDVVILDLGLPDISGVEVLRQLRGWSTVPVIVLSARHGSDDKVEALDVGADDYVTKPFGIDELLARLRAAVRRSGSVDAATVESGDLRIDLAGRRIWRDSEEVRLTPTEWGLLAALVTRPGRLVGQRQLLQEVWGPAYERETNYLRVYMANLRRKLESDPSRPRHLITEPGMGYRFLT
ncbi:MAG TPA: response regulator [Nocardioidaceae bacterium]|nr:response regulator [Nocardioidaceae bacterium]